MKKIMAAVQVMLLVVSCCFPGNTFATDTVLALLAPTGGEVIQSGGIYSIQWEASPEIVDVCLMYSTDDGGTWTIINDVATGTSYDWEIPALVSSENNCFIKIIGFDIYGEPISEVRSDSISATQAQNWP